MRLRWWILIGFIFLAGCSSHPDEKAYMRELLGVEQQEWCDNLDINGEGALSIHLVSIANRMTSASELRCTYTNDEAEYLQIPVAFQMHHMDWDLYPHTDGDPSTREPWDRKYHDGDRP